jgi:hypothetical protein
MEFKLNLQPHGQHQTVETDAFIDRARALSAYRGGVARVSAAGAGAGPAFEAARAKARDLGRNNMARVRAFQQRWSGWLKTADLNIPLLISNVLYLGLTLTALILSLITMNEHVGDFRRNEFSKHPTDASGHPVAYKPCGIPTPDSMYLLQAIGALPAAGFDGAGLEPDYQRWMQNVDRALCSRLIPGVENPVYYDDVNQCQNAGLYNDYGHAHAEELLAFGYLMDDDTITPTVDDVDAGTPLEDKFDLFEERACLDRNVKATLEVPAKDFFYTKQQREAYGDLKERVARAYLAAMPAFARYEKERDACQVGIDLQDPFDSRCKHSCHIRKELKAAANSQHAMYDNSQGNFQDSATFTQQLYRLFALSLAGYYDRRYNDGKCFMNKIQDDGSRLDAHALCKEAMGNNGVGDDESNTNLHAVTEYSVQNTKIADAGQCSKTGHMPPPPAPPIHRNYGGVTGDSLSSQVCAATLQYGLYEQGRLFGIPDIFSPFVVDNRVDRGMHFIGELIYKAMYLNPVKDAGDILRDPKAKLEMYIAYRMSATSIWCILAANVAGYMLVRAAAPVGVFILKMVGVKTNVVKSRPPGGGAPEFQPIVLVRPKYSWPVYLAMFTTLLLLYWIFWIDPATQSHYYITTECDDWAGLGVHVPSGAYVTNWGKRRFARFGEHLIGILLGLTLIFLFFEGFFGKAFTNPMVLKAALKVKLGTTARLDKIAIIMIAFALSIQILFIAQSIVSGDEWFQAIRASDETHAILFTFSKDALMSVWAALWTSAAIAWYRQKWAVDKLPQVFQLGWMAGCVLLVWMPVFHSAAYLADEIDVAFSDGKGTSDTPRLIIYIFIYGFSGIWTGLLALRLKSVWDAIPKNTPTTSRTSQLIAAKKEKWRQLIKDANQAADSQRDLADFNALTGSDASLTQQPMFNLQGMKVPPATVPVRPGRKTDAVYMPLLPR